MKTSDALHRAVRSTFLPAALFASACSSTGVHSDCFANASNGAIGMYEEGTEWLTRGQYASAVSYLQQAVTLSPGFPCAHTNLGLAYWSMHREKDAIRELSIARELAPNEESFRTNLANLLYEVHDDAGAEREYREALRINPRNAGTNYRLARTLDREGKKREAAFYLARYLETVERNPASATLVEFAEGYVKKHAK